jgi:hypothetical protein
MTLLNNRLHSTLKAALHKVFAWSPVKPDRIIPDIVLTDEFATIRKTLKEGITQLDF